ncbi:methyl-accepting chemotaxis protein [Aliikangiella sp. G2MR2-5]|uniref:methyl-accepting chemotaxis protein n=1 Tax=Aliikangiella sp. G2MR2-5 TaxID=2788943 RepID=UPI0018A9A381|nr:methyl-accepting chemotaxis protein [Aliikangiella sp. G2MR2-5]
MDMRVITSIKRSTDLLIRWMVVGAWGLSFVYANVYGTWLEAIVLGGVLAVPAFIFATLRAGEALTRHVLTVSLLGLVALHVQQLNGMVEAHFGFFVVTAFLFIYKDWKLFATVLTVGVIHHGSFYLLQKADTGIVVFNQSNSTLWVLFQHAFYLALECIVLAKAAVSSSLEAELVSTLSRITQSGKGLDFRIRDANSDNIYVRHLNSMVQQTSSALGNVKGASESMKSTVNDVSGAMQSYRNKSELQRSQTVSIASATQQMSDTFRHMVEDVSSVYEKVNASVDKQTKVSEAMQLSKNAISQLKSKIEKANDTIIELSSHSHRIGRVLDVIQSISEQTNLLALNAAIEAARAGDAGRGFAVVADEVRTLAMKTRESIDEIQTTINCVQEGGEKAVEEMRHCNQFIEDSVGQTDHANAQLYEATTLINELAQINESFVSSISQQSQAAQEIAEKVGAIRQGVEDSNSDIEQIGFAINDIEQGSVHLSEQLRHFVV